MPFVTTSSSPATELYYVDVGAGQPVVLIHGWPLSHASWENQINALVANGYRAIAYDRRGFGNSGKPASGYEYGTFASDLNDLILALDLHDAVIAGFSMGGGEVARYIGRYGTGRLSKAMLFGAVTPFLLKTANNADGVPREMFDGMIAGVTNDRIGFLDTFFTNFYNWDQPHDGVSDDLIPYSKFLAWPASAIATQQCIVAFGTTDFRADIAKIDIPTLIVHGDADRIVPFPISGKKSAAMINGSRLEVLKDAPHGFAATHPAQLNALMLDFLKR